MKKIIYIIGFLGSLSLTAGFTFKLLQFPGGNELFITGFLTFLLLFIPWFAIEQYKLAVALPISDRLKIIFGTIAAVIAGLSGLFKLMHWPGADILLMLGAIIFAFGFLPFLFLTMYKKNIS